MGLELSYVTGTTSRRKVLEHNQVLGEIGDRRNADGEQVAIKLEDLDIHVLIDRETVVDKECNCDSAFMEVMMPEVGRHLREKFHWVDCHDPIYLVMDNAGGHGTSDAIDNYKGTYKSLGWR